MPVREMMLTSRAQYGALLGLAHWTLARAAATEDEGSSCWNDSESSPISCLAVCDPSVVMAIVVAAVVIVPGTVRRHPACAISAAAGHHGQLN